MKVIRLSALLLTAMSMWAVKAQAMPANDPDSMMVKKPVAAKQVKPAGFDWAWVEVALGITGGVVLLGGTAIGVRRQLRPVAG